MDDGHAHDPAERRRRAARLFSSGANRAEVARALGVCRATATRWYRVWASGGEAALASSGRRGRPPKLDVGDLTEVRRAVARSPRARGYDLEHWSLAAVAAEIQRTAGVTYHPRHVKRVLRRLGWVLPPVGPSAPHAFCQVPAADPDGNEVLLRQTWRST